MKKQDAIQFFGSQAALARALNIHRAAVSAWDEIPIDRQCQIEVLTNRALKADHEQVFKTYTPPADAA